MLMLDKEVQIKLENQKSSWRDLLEH